MNRARRAKGRRRIAARCRMHAFRQVLTDGLCRECYRREHPEAYLHPCAYCGKPTRLDQRWCGRSCMAYAKSTSHSVHASRTISNGQSVLPPFGEPCAVCGVRLWPGHPRHYARPSGLETLMVKE